MVRAKRQGQKKRPDGSGVRRLEHQVKAFNRQALVDRAVQPRTGRLSYVCCNTEGGSWHGAFTVNYGHHAKYNKNRTFILK